MKTKLLFLSALFIGAISLRAQASAPTAAPIGAEVDFSVTVQGTTPFTYEWQKAPVGSTAFVTIPGQTAATYIIASATEADAGNYRVIVRNDFGSTISNTANLNSGAPPVITSFGLVVKKKDAAGN